MKYIKLIRQPSIDMVPGIKVTKETEITFEKEGVKQTIKDLVLDSEITVNGEGYESIHKTKVFLNEGDVLVFEEKGRGYIKPLDRFVTIEEAVEDLRCTAEVWKEQEECSE